MSDMDTREFERAILKLGFETEAKLTAASVAYCLGVPIERARTSLEQLLDKGVLEVDSDGDGNLYYYVPGGDRKDQGERESSEQAEVRDHSAGPERYSELLRIDHSLERARAGDPSGAGLDFEAVDLELLKGGGKSRSSRAFEPSFPVSSEQTSFPSSASASESAEPDSPVVGSGYTCESNPLKNNQTILASCEEGRQKGDGAPSSDRAGGEMVRSGRNSSEGGSRPDSNAAAPPERYSAKSPAAPDSRPEHHPGMSLLLSLVLCGTGQIYNGEVSKGVMMMVLCFLMWFVLLGWVVHIWAIIDSVVVAERINRQQQTS